MIMMSTGEVDNRTCHI